jgi:hypothetical protein
VLDNHFSQMAKWDFIAFYSLQTMRRHHVIVYRP